MVVLIQLFELYSLVEEFVLVGIGRVAQKLPCHVLGEDGHRIINLKPKIIGDVVELFLLAINRLTGLGLELVTARTGNIESALDDNDIPIELFLVAFAAVLEFNNYLGSPNIG